MGGRKSLKINYLWKTVMGLYGKNSGSLFLNLLVSVLLAQPGNGLSENDWTPPNTPHPHPPPTPARHLCVWTSTLLSTLSTNAWGQHLIRVERCLGTTTWSPLSGAAIPKWQKTEMAFLTVPSLQPGGGQDRVLWRKLCFVGSQPLLVKPQSCWVWKPKTEKNNSS